MARYGKRLWPSRVRDLLDDRLASVGLPARDNNVGPLRSESQAHRPSKPSASTGDNGDLASQIEEIHRALHVSASWTRAARVCPRKSSHRHQGDGAHQRVIEHTSRGESSVHAMDDSAPGNRATNVRSNVILWP
jgi:hypothetical protein